MQTWPATAARCAALAAIDPLRGSGVFRRTGFFARRGVRRRSGVRFIGFSSRVVVSGVSAA
jgi:hypothetical protein